MTTVTTSPEPCPPTSHPAKLSTSFRVQLGWLVTLLKPFVLFDPGTLTAKLEAEGRHEGDSVQLAKAGRP